jgi:hypothetical protein
MTGFQATSSRTSRQQAAKSDNNQATGPPYTPVARARVLQGIAESFTQWAAGSHHA